MSTWRIPVRNHFRRGYTRSDGTAVKPASVTSYCKTLTKAYEYSKDRFKKGVPKRWPHKEKKSSDWTNDDRNRIVEALETLPDVLLSEKIKGIYRLKKSKDYPNPASSSNGLITIYDSSFDSSRNLGRILAHELSHQNFLDLSDQEKQDYHRATGWHLKNSEDNRTIYWVGRDDGYIDDDGKFLHEEDYANNIEHYLYNSDKLRKVTPSAYEWIKKHFGDSFQLKGNKK